MQTQTQSQTLEEICERYRHLYAALIYDVLESLNYPFQALSHELAPLHPEMKLAAPAFTVKGTMSCEKNQEVRFRRLGMIKEMSNPCIEVRDAGTPFRVAIYGELSATTARAHVPRERSSMPAPATALT